MSMALDVIMTTINNDDFIKKWKESKKEQKRITLTKEAADFIEEMAFKDFGISLSSFSMEANKLILIAKDCIEKQK